MQNLSTSNLQEQLLTLVIGFGGVIASKILGNITMLDLQMATVILNAIGQAAIATVTVAAILHKSKKEK